MKYTLQKLTSQELVEHKKSHFTQEANTCTCVNCIHHMLFTVDVSTAVAVIVKVIYIGRMNYN
jgi:hypothetical protein